MTNEETVIKLKSLRKKAFKNHLEIREIAYTLIGKEIYYEQGPKREGYAEVLSVVPVSIRLNVRTMETNAFYELRLDRILIRRILG